MYPPIIQKAIDLFSKFPTVGPRTAVRFVFYLIKLPQEKFEELSSSINDLRKSIKICPSCFNPFDPSAAPKQEICSICSNNSRDKGLLCVVEKEADLESIEKTKRYKGLYFVLGGTISLRKNNEKKIRIEELKEKIKKGNFQEVIIATNPTAEGETTALLIERSLALFFQGRISRLGRGLPMGGELEYADPDTLISALDSRK